MKYIMLEFRLGVKVPIIFPESLDHLEVATALITGIPSLLGSVVSAGFIAVGKVSLLAGDSKGLGVGPMIGDDLEIMSHDHWTHAPLVEISDEDLERLQSVQGSGGSRVFTEEVVEYDS